MTNYYFVTYAAAAPRKDPDPAVRAFEAKMAALGKRYAAQTGGFITGADAIDAIAYAIKQNGGSTDGAKLAATLSRTCSSSRRSAARSRSRRRSTASRGARTGSSP